MNDVNRYAKIPNNVNLEGDRRLQRALEGWLPRYLEWWKDMGPVGPFQEKDIYLRTAVSVESDGWADFRYVKMPDYRWGIFVPPAEPGRKIGFGDVADQPVFDKVPGEFRNILRRIIVTQGDTEPASVEQQRALGNTAPSLYDLRNLFQVNVEEGRHLWAMVYLLQSYFGRDGREEADALLERRSGDPDKPRILNAFNQPCNDWLSFFAFTMFTDRDGKYQLAALAESGFDPLARTCRFMLTEEAHHMFVGVTGIERILMRSAELMRADPNGDVRKHGGIDLHTVQKAINFWYSYSLDLFGGEISSNAADYFAAGIKGRYRERDKYQDHAALEGVKVIPVLENGRLVDREVPLRTALNEVLRDEYIADCQGGLKRWNRVLEEAGLETRMTLPNRRFHRHQGEYSEGFFNYRGALVDEQAFRSKEADWFLSSEDYAYLESIMVPCTEPGKFASWIAPPRKGINRQAGDFEYVKL
jgi:benzoyl-CoA 2,3-epoxidase subunit B